MGISTNQQRIQFFARYLRLTMNSMWINHPNKAPIQVNYRVYPLVGWCIMTTLQQMVGQWEGLRLSHTVYYILIPLTSTVYYYTVLMYIDHCIIGQLAQYCILYTLYTPWSVRSGNHPRSSVLTSSINLCCRYEAPTLGSVLRRGELSNGLRIRNNKWGANLSYTNWVSPPNDSQDSKMHLFFQQCDYIIAACEWH